MLMQNRGIPWAGQLKSKSDIDEWMNRSENIPIGLYKHDSNNMISIMNMGNLNHNWNINSDQIEMYALDVHQYKSAGATFSTLMGLRNDAPQMVILYKDNLIYHATQGNISVADMQIALDKHFPLPEAEQSHNDAPPM
jgi:bacillithiol system protein YtxJ